jgi:hypothetical protein
VRIGSFERAAPPSPGATYERERRGGEREDDRHGPECGLQRRRVRQRPDHERREERRELRHRHRPTARPHGLPTIRHPLYEQGRTCARLLVAATHGELAPGDLVHLAPWQLVTRESTGPAVPS